MNTAESILIEVVIDRLFVLAMNDVRNCVGYWESPDKKGYEAAAQMALSKLRPFLKTEMVSRQQRITWAENASKSAVSDLRALGDIINRYRPEPS